MTDTLSGTAGAEYGIAPPDFRMPADLRLGAVRLRVSSLERSLAYYRDVLGMRVLRREPGIAHLGVPGADATLVELGERPGAAPVPPRGRLGLYHFAILLPDRAALGRFISHLAAIGERAGASDHMVSEALYLQDPDGLGIEVYADRPRSLWRAQNRELVMATEPLNMADLVREAGGAPWTGMPAGTVMGHVHLHVGDLERGAAFYHAALGLDRVVWSYPSALFLSAGGYHHHLGINTWAGSRAVPAGEGDARLMEWTIVLAASGDAEKAAESLRAAGFSPERDGGDWIARDPWGTTLRITIG
jgi:catechol 2,3-dioxygenase